MSTHLSSIEAIPIGALQGVTELFPVSSPRPRMMFSPPSSAGAEAPS
jgi:undecaprenyl pyrophosphate phosphatase UppP